MSLLLSSFLYLFPQILSSVFSCVYDQFGVFRTNSYVVFTHDVRLFVTHCVDQQFCFIWELWLIHLIVLQMWLIHNIHMPATVNESEIVKVKEGYSYWLLYSLTWRYRTNTNNQDKIPEKIQIMGNKWKALLGYLKSLLCDKWLRVLQICDFYWCIPML